MGVLEKFVEERGRWAFAPEDGRAMLCVLETNLEQMDCEFPFTASGIGKEQPWTVPGWAAMELTEADLLTMRAEADTRFPTEQARHEDWTAALLDLGQNIIKLAEQDAHLVKSRRRNDLEVLLLTAPVRALYKTPMMQFYRECSSIALCLALVATMPKRLACLIKVTL